MGDWWIWLILIGVMVIFFFLSASSNKKRQAQQDALHNSIKVDTEVKTIGGIIGKVVEIDEENGTMTIATGSSTIVFDKEAVYPLAAYSKNGEKVDLDALLQEANENDISNSDDSQENSGDITVESSENDTNKDLF